MIAPVRPTHFCLPDPVPSPGLPPTGTRWARGHTHTRAPLSASLKPKSRTHFVRTELTSPGRNAGVKEEAPGCWGLGGTRQRRPDLAPGSPPHAGVSGTATVECSDPVAPVHGASMCQAAGSPGLPRHSGAPWTLRLRGDSFLEASGSQFRAERILRTSSHAQVRPAPPRASSRALKAGSRPCAWNLCQVCPPKPPPRAQPARSPGGTRGPLGYSL